MFIFHPFRNVLWFVTAPPTKLLQHFIKLQLLSLNQIRSFQALERRWHHNSPSPPLITFQVNRLRYHLREAQREGGRENHPQLSVRQPQQQAQGKIYGTYAFQTSLSLSVFLMSLFTKVSRYFPRRLCLWGPRARLWPLTSLEGFHRFLSWLAVLLANLSSGSIY